MISFSNFLEESLRFSIYRSFVSLDRYIPKYFIFCCNGEWNCFLNFSIFSLLVYRNASDFCVSISYPSTLFYSLIKFSSVQFSRSVMSDSVTPWTVAYQALLSMGFSRQEYWSGLPFPSQGNHPDPGIEPASLASPALAEIDVKSILL